MSHSNRTPAGDLSQAAHVINMARSPMQTGHLLTDHSLKWTHWLRTAIWGTSSIFKLKNSDKLKFKCLMPSKCPNTVNIKGSLGLEDRGLSDKVLQIRKGTSNFMVSSC